MQTLDEMRDRGHISGETREYAEPGYSAPEKPGSLILFGNWNHCAHFRTGKHYADLAVLLRRGHAMEWEDEWSTCNDCGKAFRTQSDSYGWKPSYWRWVDKDGDYAKEICAACAKPFAWRKKWARDWAEVHYCSDRCRGNRQAAGA